MGFWRGAAFGNAINAGRSHGLLISEIEENGRMQRRLNDAEYDATLFKTYRDTIADSNKVPEATALGFALFSKARPDLLPNNATLNQRRAKNLELIAWGEFLTMRAFSNPSLSKQNASKLGSLSELVERGVFDNDKVASVLRDLSEKTQAASDAVYETTPQEWFSKRFEELKKVAKFKPGESMPTPASVNPTDPVLQITTSRETGEKVNLVANNPIGLHGLSV